MILKIKPIIISEKIEDEELSEIGLFTENLNFEKTINVAIMLPYELNKYADSIPENELLRGNSIFNIATDFHMGASMAIDSLKRKGVKINVSYFDTQNSNYKLHLLERLCPGNVCLTFVYSVPICDPKQFSEVCFYLIPFSFLTFVSPRQDRSGHS
mgnify:CR=1 FL=1